jgi:hypothetical protein
MKPNKTEQNPCRKCPSRKVCNRSCDDYIRYRIGQVQIILDKIAKKKISNFKRELK